MDASGFHRFLRSLDHLTPSQIAATIAHLGTREAIHTINAGPHLACPSCGCARGQRWGTTPAGIQRHRCSGCRTTFTARTGTPLARVHQPTKVLALITDMLALRDVSCRAAARHLDVDHTTIWRWRHLVLACMPSASPQVLTGLVEMDETYQRESRKGSREWAHHAASPLAVPTPPRLPWAKVKRKPSGLGRWSIPLLGLAPRGAAPDLVVLDRVRHTHVAQAVAGRIPADATLLTDGSLALETYAKAAGLDHTVVWAHGAPSKPSAHINTVNSLHALWRAFVRRFRGPATRYLARYASWFVATRNPSTDAKAVFQSLIRA